MRHQQGNKTELDWVLDNLLEDVSEPMKKSQFFKDHISFLSTNIEAALKKNAYFDHEIKPIIEKAFLNKEAPKTSMKIYISTAGAPLVGKSTILSWMLDETVDKEIATALNQVPELLALKRKLPNSKHIIASDPDVYGLYEIAKKYNEQPTEGFYNKWREASIVIDICVRIKALDQGYAIAHGSTATHTLFDKTIKSLVDLNYQPHIVAISAPEAMRNQNRADREAKKIYQCTPEDKKQKQISFYNNMFANRDNKFSVYGQCRANGAKLSWFGYNPKRELSCILYNNSVIDCEMLEDIAKHASLQDSGEKSLQDAGIISMSNYSACSMFTAGAVITAVTAIIVAGTLSTENGVEKSFLP